jgi:glycerophosphoryl diester phosphodiesterase
VGGARELTLEPLHPVLCGGPLLIGHRGAAGLVPENTMASFQEAVDRWAVDMIELDVRASADGHCVVIHDPTVDRTTDGTGAVAELTLAELQALDAGSRFRDDGGDRSFQGRGLRIPTIEEVLETLPDTPLTVEVKIGTAQAPLFEALRRFDAADRVVVAGMDHRDRTLFGGYAGARSGSTRDVRRFYLLHRLFLGWAWRRSCEVFQVPERRGRIRLATRRFVRDAARHRLPVHVWTVNDPAAMARLLDLGVDGIITDWPDRAARVLAERTGRPLPPALREP